MAVKEGPALGARLGARVAAVPGVRAIARAKYEISIIRAPQHYYLNGKKFQNDFIVTVECLNDNITSVDAF